MAYALNKSDNGLLITLEDGVVDSTTTSLNLIGRNAATFGERQNENFIRLLENFARSNAPGTQTGDILGPPLVGQLWYDVTNKQIKVYSGSASTDGWRPLAQLTRGIYGAQPSNLKVGDFYYATDRNTLSVFNGTDLDFVGPLNVADTSGKIYSGNTRLTAERINSQSVISLYVDGDRMLVINKGADITSTGITGLTTIKQGVNLNSLLGKFVGTATNSDSLGGVVAANYARTDASTVTFTGNVYVANNTGVSVGTAQQTDYTFAPGQVGNSSTVNNGVLTNNVDGGGWIIRTLKSGTRKNMIVVDPNDDTVTINGSLNITGTNPFIASKAYRWATARQITVTGIGSGSVSMDGSADVTLNITPSYVSVNRAGDTMTGTLNLPSNGLVVGTTLRVTNNNIGINASDPVTSVDINGSLRTRVKADYASSGAITIDALATNDHYVTLTGAATFTVSGQQVGQPVRITISGANYSIAWTNTVLWPYGVTPDLSVGPNDIAVVTLHKPAPSIVTATYAIY